MIFKIKYLSVLFLLLIMHSCVCLKPIKKETIKRDRDLIYVGVETSFSSGRLRPLYITSWDNAFSKFQRDSFVNGELLNNNKIRIYSWCNFQDTSAKSNICYALFPSITENCTASSGSIDKINQYMDTIEKLESKIYKNYLEYASYSSNMASYSCARLQNVELLSVLDSMKEFYNGSKAPLDSMNTYINTILVTANIRDKLNSSSIVSNFSDTTTNYQFICAVHEVARISGYPNQSSIRHYLGTDVSVITNAKNEHLTVLKIDSIYTLQEIRQLELIRRESTSYYYSNDLGSELILVKCHKNEAQEIYYTILYYFKKIN